MTKERVAVALSGGVDSSVAALLLKEAGYEVMGMYARLWNSSSSDQEEQQAENICHVLNIPFYSVDLEKEFEHYVVNYFCQEYQQGRTPNPCIACNQHIKFGFLLDEALSLDVDYLATGHYARIEHSNGSYYLLKAKEVSKDQSYFLYTLSQEKLKRVLFPLGNHTNAEIRQIAKQRKLPMPPRASQDICFISQKNYGAFLSQRFLSLPGDIVDAQGKILGHHRGIVGYTIGQRHGLGLALGRALYVTKIELESNRIVLGSGRELYSQKVTAKNVNWVFGEPPLPRQIKGGEGEGSPSNPIAVTAKIRYKSSEAEAAVFPTRHCDPERSEGEAIYGVWFSQPQRAVVPGQAIVFYKGEEVLGGGIIEGSQPITLQSS